MPYPETVNLPFNRSALPAGFVLHDTPQPFDDQPLDWVLVQGGNLLLREHEGSLTLPSGNLPVTPTENEPPLVFATWQGRQIGAMTIRHQTQLPQDLVMEPFNAFRERISPELITIAGIGKQLMHWQQLSRFCSRCGGRPRQLPHNWGKQCPDCATEHFPHIHPCAIVMIRRDNQLLLIRKPEWAPGRYGLVAGFLDVGESLEECAVRETREETGIAIKNIRYVTSQCWPFPSQVMAGFVAEYAGGTLCVDGNEVEDARWFSLDSLPTLPARRSIARYLIDTCARQT